MLSGARARGLHRLHRPRRGARGPASRRVLVRHIAAALLAAALVPAAARADADPASDVLLAQDVFLPFFGSRPSQAAADELNDVVAAANEDGYVIKVAVIGSKGDLGGVFTLFGKPKRYAPFLGRELAFLYEGRLLVSMPVGFGFYWQGRQTDRQQRIANTVRIRPGVDGLVRSTADAVRKVAAAEGHPVSLEADSGVPTRLVIAIAGAIILIVLATAPFAVARARRGRTAPPVAPTDVTVSDGDRGHRDGGRTVGAE